MEHTTSSQANMNHQSTFIFVTKRNLNVEPFDKEKIIKTLGRVCQSICTPEILHTIYQEVQRIIFDQIETQEIEKACIMAATSFIEKDPIYDTIATRLLLHKLQRDVYKEKIAPSIQYNKTESYQKKFIENIHAAIAHNLLDKKLLEFPLHEIAAYIDPTRDLLLEYMGLHTLYERYLLKIDNQRIEMPQMFWMRIAMGLSLNENEKVKYAKKFYDIMSQLLYVPSTPTLFHSGFTIAQLSSCYLNVIQDDLHNIFKCLGDNAQLSKWAGGIGTSWTSIRGTGSYIRGIKATSQGVIPYLKIANDVVVAITKSGIRRGGKCAYLETWHLDIEDFLDLRRNTGDERRRTHDMNTANWIPDLFIKRVKDNESWTLFSPNDTPDLHKIYGKQFETQYLYYEKMAQAGKIKNFKVISAQQLWRKMLTRLFETGHPWITFKDPCNIRSPQDHVGVIHSSNLCTEITLNTSETETAVCNLGSINIGKFITIEKTIDKEKLFDTIKTAIRMLDNVIDINFYPTTEARDANIKHRPIGLGMMGFQDALFQLDIPFSSQKALEFTDISGELFSYAAIKASMELAIERNPYSSFVGSKWEKGIFPLDTLDILEQERGKAIPIPRTSRLDWHTLKNEVKKHGMRNSNVTAIAPTATIATIAGCYPSIEPIYKNIYVKSNVSGEFTIINKYLISDLKKQNKWDQKSLDLLKYYDGDIALMGFVSDEMKEKYKTAFELDPTWLIHITATRGKWIDQSQSHNVFLKGESGKKLNEIYMEAWNLGLKTTYYLRTLGATQIEKSTLDAKQYGFTQNRSYAKKECNLDTEESCESCQ